MKCFYIILNLKHGFVPDAFEPGIEVPVLKD